MEVHLWSGFSFHDALSFHFFKSFNQFRYTYDDVTSRTVDLALRAWNCITGAHMFRFSTANSTSFVRQFGIIWLISPTV